jgi:hypothetical protein
MILHKQKDIEDSIPADAAIKQFVVLKQKDTKNKTILR